MQGKILIVVALAMGFGLAGVSNALEVPILKGVQDNFGGGTDPATPTAALVSVLTNTPRQDYDMTAGMNSGDFDRDVAETFSFSAWAGKILGATLTMKVQAGNPSSSQIDPIFETDKIRLAFVEAGDAALNAVYTVLMEDLFGSWDFGDEETIVLDLANLPLFPTGSTSIIAGLNSNGFLDAVFMDDSAVDYMLLNLTVEDPVPPQEEIPEPATLTLLAAGLVGIVLKKRKRRS